MKKFVLLISLAYILQSNGVCADAFSFANTYAANMVLHAAPRSAIIWGTADPDLIGSEVKVIVTLNVRPVITQPVTGIVRPGPDGTPVWSAVLPAMPAGGPYTVTARLGKAIIRLDNVLFGEVWLCVGADNMDMETYKTFNGTDEILGAGEYSKIRLFSLMQRRSLDPEFDIDIPEQVWTEANSNVVARFSSLCWTYGRKLHEHTKSPIGLIQATSTTSELAAWCSPSVMVACGQDGEGGAGVFPSNLWNGMIHPLLNMTITGVIWYQGEVEEDRPVHVEAYDCMFAAMVRDWRLRFFAATQQTDPQFPFGFTQLGCKTNTDENLSGFPYLRWKQTAQRAQAPNPELPNTFMAVAMDLPDFETPWGKINPRDKTTIAERLILGARSIHLKEKGIKHGGPVPIAYRFKAHSYTLELQYDKSNQIEIKSSMGFEVCCSESLVTNCQLDDERWTKAVVVKSDNTTVTLTTSRCKAAHLLGQRYAWKTNPCAYKECAVYSASGLPAHPYIIDRRIKDDDKWHPIEF